jgi:type I restriction enzyme, S subunit
MNVSEDDIEKLMLESGDILVCEGGDIGKSAIWNNEIPGAIYQKALHRIRVDRSMVEPRFLLYHIFWASEQGHFSDIKTQTTIAHLTGVKLKAYPVYVPSLTEQRRIIAYLDNLQAKIDSLKHLQAETASELNAMRPSILDNAFRGEL